GEAVLRERMRLSEDGVVVVHLSVDERRGGVIDGPRILSRGFVFEDERGSLLEDVKGIVLEVANEMKALPAPDWRSAEAEIERRLKRFFYKSIERRPLILPIIAAL
ncbi:MAG: ribonuclease J, partial [Deltaproteobacteria bacterium]|nr:ribonuclease J [Deltaproteobacteria bacterium]MBW1951287.1 ribonuclease J [Deltaproteobacteria bacterium]MBW2009712.1 ribonuclease J [Deltaproteobacteria bacterium]